MIQAGVLALSSAVRSLAGFRAGASSGQIPKKFALVSEMTCIVLVD
jgi:hypothetical protein